MNGWMGKILRVNLTDSTIKTEELNAELAKDYIGGRGLGTRFFCDEVDPKVDPLSPDNKLIMATGPLTGTNAPCGGRYMVITKGPLTNAIAASNSGGRFPAQLKATGYDMLIIEGKAAKPTCIYIHDNEVDLVDASEIWGKNTHETEDYIHEKIDKEAKVACIGPAGENLVKIACIINDKHRAAGRSGVGAVMGSKMLKAIAVVGKQKTSIANADDFKAAVKDARATMKENPTTGEGLGALGTASLVNVINASGMFPTRNFQQSVFEDAEKISGETIADTILTKRTACYSCPIGCGRYTKVEDEKFAGEGEGPEYETVWALGAACGVGNLAAVAKANYLCNELGLDTISAGSTTACAMELFQRGAITEKQTGYKLEFGSAEALVKAVEDMAYRRGVGDMMAEGAARLAKKCGMPELFMGVKGQEFPAYDPRGAKGIGINYATANRGACHVRGFTISPEVLGVPEKIDQYTTDGKARLSIDFQNTTSIVDATGICLFVTFAIGPDEILAMLEGATGAGYDMESMLTCGERIWNLERLFNLEAGFTAADDNLPKRIVCEPIPEGASKGQVCELDQMLPEYYELRGWDKKGVPTDDKLAELGLAKK